MAEGARLESVCTPKGYHEFESHRLRNVTLANTRNKAKITAIVTVNEVVTAFNFSLKKVKYRRLPQLLSIYAPDLIA